MRSLLRGRGAPYVTLAILFLNVAGFLAEAIMGETRASLTFAMYEHALSVGPGAIPRVFVCAFMHYGIVHLACNMLALLSFGLEMERFIGWWRYLIIYVAGIIGSALMVNFFGGNGMHMGASGPIWGLMAAMLVVILKLHGNAQGVLRALVMNLVFTFTVPGISWQGHIGGGIAGLAAALIVLSIRPPRRGRISVADLRPIEADPSDKVE